MFYTKIQYDLFQKKTQNLKKSKFNTEINNLIVLLFSYTRASVYYCLKLFLTINVWVVHQMIAR
jgi:hypothetical protein